MKTVGENASQAGGVPEKKRILLVQYGHESSTVNPFTTGLERFGGSEQLISGNPLADLGSYIPDFRAALAGRGDVEVVETVDAWANPWGRVERKVNETVKSIIRDKIAAAAKGCCSQETVDELLAALEQFGLPTQTEYPLDDMVRAVYTDKKLDGDTMHLVVPEAIGRCRIQAVPITEVRDWMRLGGIG